jgi:hypothetical protein
MSILIKLGDISGPFDRNPTRWDELRQTVSIVVDLASVYVVLIFIFYKVYFCSFMYNSVLIQMVLVSVK